MVLGAEELRIVVNVRPLGVPRQLQVRHDGVFAFLLRFKWRKIHTQVRRPPQLKKAAKEEVEVDHAVPPAGFSHKRVKRVLQQRKARLQKLNQLVAGVVPQTNHAAEVVADGEELLQVLLL